jgi:hypothetical protein
VGKTKWHVNLNATNQQKSEATREKSDDTMTMLLGPSEDAAMPKKLLDSLRYGATQTHVSQTLLVNNVNNNH